MINTYKDFNKYTVMVILIILFIFIAIYLWPYVNGLLGAFILFVLFLPLHKLFTEKLNIGKSFSAIIIIVITLLIVIIPSYFIVMKSYNEINELNSQKDQLILQIKEFELKHPEFKISEKVNEYLPNLTNWTIEILFKNINNIIKSGITLIIMYFLLFYLLIYHKELYKVLKEYLPFSTKNSIILAREFKRVTYSTLITTGLLAIIQGFLLGLGFWLLHIKGAILWGLLAAILSFLPVLGIPLIWIPYAFIFLIRQEYFTSVAIVILGLIVNYSELFIRPYLQKKMGNIHPLVSILGIFIGVSAFGFVGIVIGPLIISYFILTLRIFKEEYLE